MDAYTRASEKTRRLFNKAVFKKVLVRGGRVAEAEFQGPFDALFSTSEFEYATVVVPAFQNANRIVPLLEGPLISLAEGRGRVQPTGPKAAGHLIGSDGSRHSGMDPAALIGRGLGG